MKRLAMMIALTAGIATAPAIAQTSADDARFQQAQQRFQNELRIFQQEFDRYQAARANRQGYDDRRYDDQRRDPRDLDRYENGYDAARYYRGGENYQERVLGPDERVYRGNDGRYYCRRSDGTTGLIIGAAGGGILGNVIDGGHSRAVGTLLGGALGALAGRAIDRQQSEVRCR